MIYHMGRAEERIGVGKLVPGLMALTWDIPSIDRRILVSAHMDGWTLGAPAKAATRFCV